MKLTSTSLLSRFFKAKEVSGEISSDNSITLALNSLQVVNQCLEFIGFLVLHVLLNHRNLTLQEGTGGSDFFQLYLRTRSLKDGRNGSSRHFEHPEYLTDYRNGEQILLLGRVYLAHLLRGNDDRLFCFEVPG